MKKLQAGLVILTLLAPFAVGSAIADNRFLTQEAVDMIEQRQDTMARMLEAVDQVVPRLGANRAAPAPMNPSHWPLIRKQIETTRALLSESEGLWASQTNLGYGSITSAEPGIWSLPEAFERRYGMARTSLTALEAAIEQEDADGARSGLCALVQACGECHAAYRVIDTESLIREGVSWLGQYPGCVRRY